MKYVEKTAAIEAIQVVYGKGGWPAWLKDAGLCLRAMDEDEKFTRISEGDYLVREADGTVAVVEAAEFEARYKPARKSRAKSK